MMPRRSLALIGALAIAPTYVAAQQTVDATVRIDSIFQRWDLPTSPGCALGIDNGGDAPLFLAYGMADLEHDIPNEPTTIFEAGSVSKQFTAAAVVLLALDGKVSLDDDIRKYIPEVPEYDWPITIRHMLNHTSGLRDWGSVAGLSGWGRGSRVHTHDHVLEIVSRQSALNFQPGHEYSYSNTGYNLLVILVDRVSGMPFAEFTRERIFEPLGMTNTEWRDDYTRIVKNRAQAYEPRGGTFALDMPFENVHGNGGLLTTVGDLLVWNESLDRATLGQRFVDTMHQVGVLNDGSSITYAAGLMVDEYRGTPEVSHTGSTAGYRAFLARYPDHALSVALLCNVGNASPGTLGHRVVDALIGDALTPVPPPTPRRQQDRPQFRPSPEDLAAYAGTYHSDDAEATLTVELELEGEAIVGRMRPNRRLTFVPTEPDVFTTPLGTVRFIRDDSGAVIELSVRQARVYDMRYQRIRQD